MSGWDEHWHFKGKLKEVENEENGPYAVESPEIDLSIVIGDGNRINDQYEDTIIRIGNAFELTRLVSFSYRYITYDNREIWIDSQIDTSNFMGECVDYENYKRSIKYIITELDQNGSKLGDEIIVKSPFDVDIRELNNSILNNLKNDSRDLVIINNNLCGILFKKDMHTISIPNNVKEIKSFFINGLDDENDSINEIILSDSITAISKKAQLQIHYDFKEILPNLKYVEKDNLLFLKSESNDKFLLVRPKNLFTDSITISDDTRLVCLNFIKDYFIKKIVIENNSLDYIFFRNLAANYPEVTFSLDDIKKNLSSFNIKDNIKEVLTKIKTVEDIDYVFPKIIYKGNIFESKYINEEIERINIKREKSIGLFKELYFRYQKDVKYISDLINLKFEKRSHMLNLLMIQLKRKKHM